MRVIAVETTPLISCGQFLTLEFSPVEYWRMEKEFATSVLATRHHQTVTTIELVCVQCSRKVTIDVDGRKCKVGGVVFGKDCQQVSELGVTTSAG